MLTDGSARVWDIRDPEERSEDAELAWAEREPAGKYLEILLAGGTPTDELQSVIERDPSLSPLRRLVAAEMVGERLWDLADEARRVLGDISAGLTEKSDVLAAVEAAELELRLKAMVVELTGEWEYAPPRRSQAELARLAEARRISALVEPEGDSHRGAIRDALVTQVEILGVSHPEVALTLSRFPAYCYQRGLWWSADDWPMARRIAQAFWSDPNTTGVDRARAFAGAAAVAVDAGEFEQAAMWFSRLESIPSAERGDVYPYFSVSHNEPTGRWRGELTGESVRRRAIELFGRDLLDWVRHLRPGSIESGGPAAAALRTLQLETAAQMASWMEAVPAYRDELAHEHALLYYRLGKDAEALRAIMRARAVGTAVGGLGDRSPRVVERNVLRWATLAMVRWALAAADQEALVRAAEFDEQFGRRILSVEEHRAAAREALAQAQAIVAGEVEISGPETGASAVLHEAAALIGLDREGRVAAERQLELPTRKPP